MRLEGFFSLEGAYSKVAANLQYRTPFRADHSKLQAYQFLCELNGHSGFFGGSSSTPDVNCHPIETCDLHRTIEGVFARSSFGKHVCGSIDVSVWAMLIA